MVVLVSHFTGIHVASTCGVFSAFLPQRFFDDLADIRSPTRGRLGAFFVNRALRLYPLYWGDGTACHMLLALMLWPSLSVPGVKQLLLIVRWDDSPLYNPIAWAVTNKIAFYIAIGFGISKNLRRTSVWFTLSRLATAVVYIHVYLVDRHSLDNQADLVTLYLSLWCGSLPFSLGSLLYHHADADDAASGRATSPPRCWSVRRWITPAPRRRLPR